MILVLGSHSQVRTLQERQVPKALKILALERVLIVLSCLRDIAAFCLSEERQLIGLGQIVEHVVSAQDLYNSLGYSRLQSKLFY